MDISVVPHAAPHAVAHVKPVIHTILIGVTYMTAAIYSAIALVSGFGLGWYVKGRGLTGVQNDINNVKLDIAALKAKIGA